MDLSESQEPWPNKERLALSDWKVVVFFNEFRFSTTPTARSKRAFHAGEDPMKKHAAESYGQ
jgi:hypothetical protein